MAIHLVQRFINQSRWPSLPGLMLAASLFTAPVSAETLVVFGSEAYPPVAYLEDGHPRGIFPALLAKLESETGDHYDVRLLPWKRAQLYAMAGEGGIMNLSWNPERAAALDFSLPLYEDRVVLVVLKGNEFSFKKLEDLRGKKIGVGSGSSYRSEVDQAIRDHLFEIDPDPAQVNRLRKLLAHRIDAAMMGTGTAGVLFTINTDPMLAANRDQFSILPTPVTLDPLFIAFPKSMGKQAVIERLNEAYIKLKKAGALRDILGY